MPKILALTQAGPGLPGFAERPRSAIGAIGSHEITVVWSSSGRIESLCDAGLEKEKFSMRRMLFAAAAIGGLTALSAFGAAAAPSAARVHAAPSHTLVTPVDYYWNHHHWHHRHWEHDHWRYWN
jgi:hypothetical protein